MTDKKWNIKTDRPLIVKAIGEAKAKAALATSLYLSQLGGDNYPCGFAWVTIRPARGPWVTVLKDLGIGKTDAYLGGYMVWNPSGNKCQNVDAKVAGANAFAEELRKYGVKAVVGSRWD